jgi:hypothetical protein
MANLIVTDLNMYVKKDDYLTIAEKKEITLQGLITKFKKEGLPEQEAVNKARLIMFKPDKLAKLDFFEPNKNAGLRPSVCFFFDNSSELLYLQKFFKVNLSNQVKNTNELLKILKFYEDNKIKPETKLMPITNPKEEKPIKSPKGQITLGGFI